jgi:soluble lytic murein transglycosylase
MTFNQKLSTLILACLCAVATAPIVSAQNGQDDVLIEMGNAYKRGDKAKLSALLPQARGHVLEGQAAYWELKARLEDASAQDVQDYLQRYTGTYHEDRLRNDWLLLLGKRRDFTSFAAEYPRFRMNDDKEVRCYALAIEQQRMGLATSKELVDEVRRNWWGIKDSDEGCTLAAEQLFNAKLISSADVWREARLSIEVNRASAARNAVAIVAPDLAGAIGEINASPAKYLTARFAAPGRARKELILLALIKLATSDPDAAGYALETKWSPSFNDEERSWAWGVVGKQSALKLSDQAGGYFAKAENQYLNDDLLGWKARAALRATEPAKGWPVLLAAVNAMGDEGRKDPAFVYWKARALKAIVAGGPNGNVEMAKAAAKSAAHAAATAAGATATLVLDDPQLEDAHKLLESIASPRGFYEVLALEELGQRVSAPARPAPPTAAEREAARLNPGLNRALYAITIGLRPEGVREWNYSTNLHSKGGLAERELLAAADFACQREVWDRCVNTSERTKESFDAAQRFVMPFKEQVLRHSKNVGLDPAYVYGLIRQESRFIMNAQSGVGAAGLMQVIPSTARWTAKKIGLEGFSPSQMGDSETNITIGTAYLKLALDDFSSSMPLAAAAYNAGPGRPRAWRNGPVMEAAAWAENLPFAETRDYVKKVLYNTTMYAALITGQPQSLKTKLGSVGPMPAGTVEPVKDLP